MPVNITADKAIRHTVLGMRANLHTVFVCIKSPHIYVLWAVLRCFASYTPFCFTITIIITYLTCRFPPLLRHVFHKHGYKIQAVSITQKEKGGVFTGAGVEIIKRNAGITAVISGEIGHFEASGIRIRIDAELERLMPSMLILDMSGVSFMDSSGIGLILGRQRIMESFGGGVAVKNPSPSVRRIIQVAGLSRLIISGKNTEDKK